jgi:hypothetical protein
MKSIPHEHIVVVAGSDQALVFAAQLRRMEVARVTAVAPLEQARGLCQAGDADACIVAIDEFVPDAAPMPETDAPGRRCGYLTTVPATIAPRMLYRRIGAALQRRRAASRRRRRMPPVIAIAGRPASIFGEYGKPTIH